MIPLEYVIWPDKVVSYIGSIQAGTPHLENHDSLKDEIIDQASFVHPLYWEENETIYYGLE